jgi:hypothetical protein
MPPKPVPAWLNSSAWASKPRSPVRSSYSFKEISTIQRETTSAAPVGEIGGQEEKDPSSSSSGGGSVRGAVTHQQTATLTTQARGNGLGTSSQQVWLNYSQATLLRDGSPQPLSPTAEEKSEKTASSFDFLVTLFNTEVGHGDWIQQLLEQIPSLGFFFSWLY